VQKAFCRRPAAVVCFVPFPEVVKQENIEDEMVRMGKMGWGTNPERGEIGSGSQEC
jgi:hypothetical protein